MDGTLVDSRSVIETVWRRWARRHTIDWDALHHALHGVQIADTVRRFAPPGVDVDFEVNALAEVELTEIDGIVPVPGSDVLLSKLSTVRWGVVTSAVREMARIRIDVAGLPIPDVLVAAEDVTRGKPHPEGYRMAADALGVAADEIVVFEDSDAGMEVGRAAGCRTSALRPRDIYHSPMPTIGSRISTAWT